MAGNMLGEVNKLGQFNVFRKINKGSSHVQGNASRSGKCQVLGMRDYTWQNGKKYLANRTQNHTSKQEILINKVMQRALVDFTELANSKTSYSASLSGVDGSKKRGGSNNGQRKRQNAEYNRLQCRHSKDSALWKSQQTWDVQSHRVMAST